MRTARASAQRCVPPGLHAVPRCACRACRGGVALPLARPTLSAAAGTGAAKQLRLPLPAGDVAFTKHTSPLEYARDGSEPQPWSSKNKVGWLPAQAALAG